MKGLRAQLLWMVLLERCALQEDIALLDQPRVSLVLQGHLATLQGLLTHLTVNSVPQDFTV